MDVGLDDVRKLLDCVQRLYACDDIYAFPDVVIDVIPMLVRSDRTAYNEVNLKRRRVVGKMDGPPGDAEVAGQLLMKHAHEHPLIEYYNRTRDGGPRKISDFLSVEAFHRTGLYAELYGPRGFEDQMSIALPVEPPDIVAVIVNRKRRDFTERDRTLLGLLLPHIDQAYRQAETATRLRERLAGATAALDQLDLAVVRVDGRGRPTFTSAAAREWLGVYYPDLDLDRQLPADVEAWLNQVRKRPAENRLPSPRTPMELRRERHHLSLRYIGDGADGGGTLVLERLGGHDRPESLLRLGLTEREADVLYWVTRGKTNPEIGTILGSSPRTVQKHLERVFAKLGVETRTAAAMRAMEVMRGGTGEISSLPLPS